MLGTRIHPCSIRGATETSQNDIRMDNNSDTEILRQLDIIARRWRSLAQYLENRRRPSDKEEEDSSSLTLEEAEKVQKRLVMFKAAYHHSWARVLPFYVSKEGGEDPLAEILKQGVMDEVFAEVERRRRRAQGRGEDGDEMEYEESTEGNSRDAMNWTTTTKDCGIISPFLRLPPELRAVIYEFATAEYDLKHRFGGTYRSAIRHGLLPSFSLVCRQIRKEYIPVVKKRQTLVLSDRFLPEICIHAAMIVCNPIQRVRNLQVFLFAHCESCTDNEPVPHACQVGQEIEEHTQSLNCMISFLQHNLRSLEVRMDVAWPKAKGQWPESPHHPSLAHALSSMAKVKGITGIVVHRRREALKKESRADEIAEWNDDLFVSWDGKEGWKGAREEIEDKGRKETRSDSAVDVLDESGKM